MKKFLKYFLIVTAILAAIWLMVVFLFYIGVFKININIGPF